MPALAAPAPHRVLLAVAMLLSVLAAACGGGQASPSPSASIEGDEASAVPTATDSGDPTANDPTALDPDTAAVPANTPATGPEAPGVTPPSSTGGPVDVAAGIPQILGAMSVEQKVGQLFTVTVIGDDATQPSQAAATANLTLYGVATPAEVVATYHLGGIAYFDHDQGAGTSNVDDLTRTRTLSEGLQQAAADDTGIGLLIGTDQEGGRVVRLRAPVTIFPSARAFGDSGRVDLAEAAGRVTAQEAGAVGVNWIYAPDADVNVNPDNPVIGDRAYGTTADIVTPFVTATARGLATGGALPTLKHFPGHGDTDIDSHSSLPTIDHDRETLDAVDLPPFAGATELGLVSVMVGHLAVPAIDPSGAPATLSAPIMDLLRSSPTEGGLGYDGLVVTDAMNMGALQDLGDSGTLAVGALNAGIDMVLMPVDLPQAWTAVRDAVVEGRISPQRLDQAVARILTAKANLGVLDAAAIVLPSASVIGSPAHAEVRRQIGAICGC